MENEEDKEKKEEDNNSEDEEEKESEKVSEGKEIEEKKDEEDASEISDIPNDDVKQEIDNSEEIADDVERKETIDEEINKTSEENKQLKKVFVVIGILAVFFIGVFLFINSVRQFTYEGIDFDVVKEGEMILYQTSLPVNSEHKVTGGAVFANYNFYLRNDPRKLKNLPFEGEITLLRNMVINFTGDFKCEGRGTIAVANLGIVLEAFDVEMITDETAGCDPEGEYTFLQLQIGNETSIEQFGPSCYNLNINNCEVLEVTEKYILELLAGANRALDK